MDTSRFWCGRAGLVRVTGAAGNKSLVWRSSSSSSSTALAVGRQHANCSLAGSLLFVHPNISYLYCT